jgi:hypothetical protein
MPATAWTEESMHAGALSSVHTCRCLYKSLFICLNLRLYACRCLKDCLYAYTAVLTIVSMLAVSWTYCRYIRRCLNQCLYACRRAPVPDVYLWLRLRVPVTSVHLPLMPLRAPVPFPYVPTIPGLSPPPPIHPHHLPPPPPRPPVTQRRPPSTSGCLIDQGGK